MLKVALNNTPGFESELQIIIESLKISSILILLAFPRTLE